MLVIIDGSLGPSERQLRQTFGQGVLHPEDVKQHKIENVKGHLPKGLGDFGGDYHALRPTRVIT